MTAMEFSDIQPVSQSGQLQPTSISSAADLSSIFNSRANAGDQIEMFLAIAEGQPETAITSFSTVVRNLTSPPIKALALQGFGKISQPYKHALALCSFLVAIAPILIQSSICSRSLVVAVTASRNLCCNSSWLSPISTRK